MLLLLSHLSRVRLCVTPQTAPNRLPRPWDSPGKNTGVSCHFLLQGMKVKSESEVVQSCPTPSDPMDCSLPGSSVHGILQARVLEWVPLKRHLVVPTEHLTFAFTTIIFHNRQIEQNQRCYRKLLMFQCITITKIVCLFFFFW